MKQKVKEILSKMTLEDKARLCSGRNYWTLESVLGLPNILMSDGPHGLRKQEGNADLAGINSSVASTCYPTAAGLASTWNNELIYQVGEHLGEECRTNEISVLLGPGVNIKRHPLCGRNFEYFSEDPYLSGTLAANFINGVQSKGIGTSIKHFVAYNRESMRFVLDTFIDERALREIYLKGFEIAVKESQPWTVMCSYNLVNGTYQSENKRLLNDILKEEWKHEGLVVTDWGACNDRVKGLIAGQELEMPGGTDENQRNIIEAVKSGTISEDILDERVAKIIELILKSQETLNQNFIPYDKESHHNFARRVATETMVLLKNEDHILPLNKNQKVALIGEFAVKPRFQGGGSSLVAPTKITNAKDAFEKNLGDKLLYSQGYRSDEDISDQALLDDSINTAKQADVVVLMVGLTHGSESEGFDRTHLNIPNNQLELIKGVTKVNKNVVIALSNGSPIVMPWKQDVKAILEQYLAGQASGEALADVLFGKANPSGKLAETFPNHLDEFPSNQNFSEKPRQIEYREGLYVGYRYYDTANKEPLYPFGHGLSYTSFSYDHLSINVMNNEIKVSFTVTNTGDKEGKEISQLYIGKKDSIVYRPDKELKGYAKTTLQPQESKTVEISVPIEMLAVYNKEAFKIENGEYEVLVGASSRDIRLTKFISVKGTSLLVENDDIYKNITSNFSPTQKEFEQILGFKIPEYPTRRPFTMNSVISELQDNAIGKQLHDILLEKASNPDNDKITSHIVEAMINEMPIRSLSTLSGGMISHSKGQELIDMMNKEDIKQ
ncbi:glycoside hydrolase family 3 C-terminal domain-containing protein [Clostridiaceae bacterium M8S5]|nr:glycoside hydrolase family 3 C-terminal domain-containing protein [Clostridiaceae bacterium M8S5]